MRKSVITCLLFLLPVVPVHAADRNADTKELKRIEREMREKKKKLQRAGKKERSILHELERIDREAQEQARELDARRRKLQEAEASLRAVSEGEGALTVRWVDDEDWAHAWKSYFRPLRVGRRFVVCPTWETWDAAPSDRVLRIDPGMAFGTGAHPTTQLCLELIEETVAPGQRVLDAWLGGRDDLTVVGDANQTIYSFAGASPQPLLNFARRFPEAVVVRLERDYRSTPQVVALANDVIKWARGRPAGSRLNLVGQRPEGPPPRFHEFDDEPSEADSVARRTKTLLDEGVAGDNVGVLLRGVEKTDVERGQVLAKPGSIKPHTKFKGEVYILSKEEGGRHTPFFNGYRPQFYIRTTDVTGTLKLPDGVEMVMPGDNTTITGELITPVAIEKGSRFAIREGGRTVGAGTISEILE